MEDTIAAEWTTFPLGLIMAESERGATAEWKRSLWLNRRFSDWASSWPNR